MSKVLYALSLALVLACAATAQTRRGATGNKPKPAPGAAATPTPRQTPAAGKTPAQPSTQGAAAQTAPAGTKNDDCGCEDKPLPDVLALVNGIKITTADISPQVQQQVKNLQQQVADARKNELDLQINSVLLEAESKKRGVSSTKLLEDEIIAKTVEPTVADAQTFFNQNKAQIEQQAGRAVEFAEAKDWAVRTLREQRQSERSKQFADSLRAGADVKVLAPQAPPPATPAERARVLATVNGKSITAGDIEDSLRGLVAQVQEQVYLLRKDDLDQKVNDILLAQEAQKRGVTTQAILDAEIKSPVVTEAQALDFYNKNKERINGEFAQVKYQIIEYLQDQEKYKQTGALAEKLRNGANVQTFITPPAPPVFNIATDDQPTKGNASAAVTVVEFTDYQCPTCAKTQPVLERLIAEYGDRVRFVVRDFPLQQHPDASKAAEAAEAAREQGKYWDFTAILFHNQSALGVEQLKQYAGVLGLDRAKFDAALASGKYADQVQRDILDGQKVGVNGTPSFFINGRRVSDITYEGLKAAIETTLKSPSSR